MDLIEADNIKKRCQEYTELYKKDLHDPNNHNSVIIHLETDILGVQNQVGLRKHHYKASGGEGISAELFQLLKMML